MRVNSLADSRDAARPVSGEQFVLRHGAATVQVGQVAAVLRDFSVAGTRYTETWDDAELPPLGCGIVLVPWPNRVADGRWTYDGITQQLDITEPSRGHASHGLLRNTAYQPVSVTPAAVTLAASIYPQHGYPFTLDTTVTYRLVDEGLVVTHSMANAGRCSAPFGVGAHPYLRVGEVPVSELVLTVRAATVTTTDERLIPTGARPVSGADDLRGGARLADLSVDAAFTDITAHGGRVEHRLTAPGSSSDGRDAHGVVLWADEAFGWVQVYTPGKFPAADTPDGRLAVAVEPMTCGPNAFNTGLGLRTLQPGETWSASWGLTPF